MNFYTFIFFGFCCLLSLGQLQRIEPVQFGLSIPAFYLHDVFFGILLGGSFIVSIQWRSFMVEGVKNAFRNKLTLIFLVIFLLGWGRAAVMGQDLLRPALYVLRILLYALTGMLFFYLKKEGKISSKNVFNGLLLFCGLLLYFGFLQYFLIPDTRSLFYLGWDDHYYRMISTLLDPGFTGIFLVLGYVLLWKEKHSMLHGAGQLLLVIGVLLTYSRATYLAFVFASIALMVLFSRKYSLAENRRSRSLLVGAFLVLFLVGIPLLPRPGGEGVKLERTSSISSRTGAMTEIMGRMNPGDWVIGKGMFVTPNELENAEYQTENHGYLPDNWMLTFLSGVGLGGCMALAVLAWQFARLFFVQRGAVKAQLPKFLFGVGVVSVLIHGMFNATLFLPFMIIFLLSWYVAVQDTC